MNDPICQPSTLIELDMTDKGMSYLLSLIVSLVFFTLLFSCGPEKPAVTSTPQAPPGESGDVTPLPSIKEEAMKGESEKVPVNNPPVVEKAKLQLETLNNIDVLKVVAFGVDKDGDEVSLSYEWTKNGEPASNTDTVSGFKRGDILSVKITPFNGKSYGQPKVLTTEISNCTPRIVEHREIKFDGKLYSCLIKAIDPDGDPLTYSLKSAPAGMTIDPSTGLIHWNVPPDFRGKTPIIVLVTDNHGGESSQSLVIEITPEIKK